MDILKVQMPNYYITFKEKNNYKFSSECVGKKNLKKILLENSKGYCMYCYSRVQIDEKNYGHLEHTIEQDTIAELSDCHYNISIACPTCNLSYKKTQQKERKISPKKIVCEHKNCKDGPCKDFYRVANEYLKNMEEKKLDKIILKPRGTLQPSLGEEIHYDIEFDLLNQKFVPKDNDKYTEITKKFIKSHIDKFHLNDEKMRTKEIAKVIEDILEYQTLPKKDRYNNLVAELFIAKLEGLLKELKKVSNDNDALENIMNICRTISSQMLLKSLL